ncbi:hypothetical protein RAMLITH_05525 [Ramlibacter sp. RBP-2]|uniref:Uncharacterized protein n=1 Tax=Ramlibacter lithotrophicus TaxID=2606681 RepID=A0A7X6I5P0_9BURK|nr:hypothetical protein [Ramlibacter lithotrophicus]NKE65274.1 hypothetical protein [Ramlibacter lithotrophicus]
MSAPDITHPFKAASALALLLYVVFLCVPNRAWADRSLEQALAAKDPKAVQRVIREAATVEPHLLMQAAVPLLEGGQRDQAVFWFYSGQLRARYWPTLQGQNAQILTILVMTLGEQVNAAAFRDIPALVKTLDAVVAWDEKTFARWAVAMKLDPTDPTMRERRRKAIDGLGPFKARLLAEREALEQQAREYKSPAQIEKEREEAVARNYSQAPVEVDVAGTRFRVPAHYISPQGEVARSEQRLPSIGFWVFLPDFGGYTRDNWRQPLGDPAAILIRVAAETRARPEDEVERFLAEGGADTERVGDREATVYDYRKTQARLPVNVVSRHHVFKAVKAGGGPYYAVCDAERGISEEGARCEMFFGDAQRGLRVSALFRRIHLVRMAEIEERLSAMLESWIVK